MKSVLALLLLFTSMVQANNFEGEQFIKGCNELVGIYKNKSERRLLASQLASSEDSILAGYCMGVIKAYKQIGNPRVYREQVQCGYRVRGPCYEVKEVTLCKHNDWFEIAEAVASHWGVKKSKDSISKLLESICNG